MTLLALYETIKLGLPLSCDFSRCFCEQVTRYNGEKMISTMAKSLVCALTVALLVLTSFAVIVTVLWIIVSDSGLTQNLHRHTSLLGGRLLSGKGSAIV